MSDAFKTLNAINVQDHVEKKNDLSYLSWAWAWGKLKELYPDAQSTVYETESGRIYWDDGKTAWVKTGVTVEGLEHIEYLPIMDYRNKSIPLDQITSTDVNKAIQRSITKAIARHGLGLYIYAGEDLPEAEIIERREASAAVIAAKRKVVEDKCIELNVDLISWCKKNGREWKDISDEDALDRMIFTLKSKESK